MGRSGASFYLGNGNGSIIPVKDMSARPVSSAIGGENRIALVV